MTNKERAKNLRFSKMVDEIVSNPKPAVYIEGNMTKASRFIEKDLLPWLSNYEAVNDKHTIEAYIKRNADKWQSEAVEPNMSACKIPAVNSPFKESGEYTPEEKQVALEWERILARKQPGKPAPINFLTLKPVYNGPHHDIIEYSPPTDEETMNKINEIIKAINELRSGK